MLLRIARASDGREITFYYDPFQRLVAHHWGYPRGNDELYYDGPDVAIELRHTASGNQWLRYVHGQQTDQPLAVEVYPYNAAPTPGTGQQFYYHADGEGSIRLLTNATGQVANRYDYDSYGRRLTETESLPLQPYGWKGREWVPGPDIYYNRARFYDPVLGRFMSQDPLGYGGGDTNLYSFAWNNPVNWNDPSGLYAEKPDGPKSGNVAGQYAAFAQNAVNLVPKLAAIGCSLSIIYSGLAAQFAGDAEHEVVGTTFKLPCWADPVLALRVTNSPGGGGGKGSGTGSGGDDNDPCDRGYKEELDYCRQYYPARNKSELMQHCRAGCRDRASSRLAECRRTGEWPDNYSPKSRSRAWNHMRDCLDFGSSRL